MHGVGVIAVRRCEIRLELRLQVGSVELGEQLAGTHDIAFAHVDHVGGFGQGALNRDVLIWGDHTRQLPRGLNRAVGRHRRLDVGRRRRGRRLVPGAAAAG